MEKQIMFFFHNIIIMIFVSIHVGTSFSDAETKTLKIVLLSERKRLKVKL